MQTAIWCQHRQWTEDEKKKTQLIWKMHDKFHSEPHPHLYPHRAYNASICHIRSSTSQLKKSESERESQRENVSVMRKSYIVCFIHAVIAPLVVINKKISIENDNDSIRVWWCGRVFLFFQIDCMCRNEMHSHYNRASVGTTAIQ